MVCKSNDSDVVTAFTNHNVVWKPPKRKSLCAELPGGCSEGRCQRNDVLFQQIKRRMYCALKFLAQSVSLALIPSSRFCRLVCSRGQNAHDTHDYRRMRSRMRLLNSSRSTKEAVPASTSASRLEISASHSWAASCSGGPSRLETRSCASSARSASVSSNASARTRSNAELLMAITKCAGSI